MIPVKNAGLSNEHVKQPLRTSTLLRRLFKSPDLDTFLTDNNSSIYVPSFIDELRRLCEEKDIVREKVIRRSGIERSFGYQLFRGVRRPSRDNVIRLAFGFSLSVSETQNLLKHARKPELYPKIKRDAIILFSLSRGITMIELQNLLNENELTLLGDEKYGHGE
jgi:transcriptional regulator with XRE-family HTH domain